MLELMGAPSSWVATGTMDLIPVHVVLTGTTLLGCEQQHLGAFCGRGHCQTPLRSAVSTGQQAGANQVPAIKSSFGKLMSEWWQWQGVAHRNLLSLSNEQEVPQSL